MSKSLLSLAVTTFILGGCSLIPDYQTPESPVAASGRKGRPTRRPSRPTWLRPNRAGASSSMTRRCSN